MLETALYPTVKRFLEAAGFDVKGEVDGCDVVAVRDGDCAANRDRRGMKLGFNLPLLLQAVDRMRAADELWLVVPATRRGRDRDIARAPAPPVDWGRSYGSRRRARWGRGSSPSLGPTGRGRITAAALGCSANTRGVGATRLPAARHARR